MMHVSVLLRMPFLLPVLVDVAVNSVGSPVAAGARLLTFPRYAFYSPLRPMAVLRVAAVGGVL
jgi:hypothetical protein